MIRALALTLLLAAPAGAQTTGFRTDPARPGALIFTGDILTGSSDAFARALSEAPEVTALWLDSPGGDVDAALAMADAVFARKMATVVAPNAWCASACAYVFLAGRERIALGAIGVHQFMTEGAAPDGTGGASEAEAQAVVADIMAHLTEYGAPPRLMVRMLSTPNDDMYWFSKEELAADGIVTAAPDWEHLLRVGPAVKASQPRNGSNRSAAPAGD